VFSGLEQMLKCDLCYDRTSLGQRPMCATVCPSQALLFAPRHEVAGLRGNKPLRTFLIGTLVVKTRNAIMVPDPETPLHLSLDPGARMRAHGDASLLCDGDF